MLVNLERKDIVYMNVLPLSAGSISQAITWAEKVMVNRGLTLLGLQRGSQPSWFPLLGRNPDQHKHVAAPAACNVYPLCNPHGIGIHKQV